MDFKNCGFRKSLERDQVIFVLLHRFDLEMLSVDITPILEHYSSK